MSQTQIHTSEHVKAHGWREAMVLKRLERLHTGALCVMLPSGEDRVFYGSKPGPEAAIEINSPRMVSRLLRGGSVGFAEGYIHDDWDSPDLDALIYLLHLNEDALEPDFSRARFVHAVISKIRHRLHRNSRRGSRRNIAYHYDLGNDFYAHWLDHTWTYSGGVFESPGDSLETAQKRKYQKLLERIAPTTDDHVLELGCGWGGFALYAARETGCRVTGVTLSTEQLRFARERAQAEGLADRLTFELCDYRDVTGRYDHIVSIEMYEAVGEAYWPTYFKVLADRLKPGGRIALQAITIDDERFEFYRNNVDFIQEYIFPGGMLASPSAFQSVAGSQGLTTLGSTFYGRDYARTLRRWDERVVAARDAIIESRGAPFWRMWRYYLAYSAAGFTSGNIDLMQITLTHDS